jgi:hypothetical protein
MEEGEAYFKVLSQQMHGQTNKNMKKLSQDIQPLHCSVLLSKL